jgi:hypothetical protein
MAVPTLFSMDNDDDQEYATTDEAEEMEEWE